MRLWFCENQPPSAYIDPKRIKCTRFDRLRQILNLREFTVSEHVGDISGESSDECDGSRGDRVVTIAFRSSCETNECPSAMETIVKVNDQVMDALERKIRACVYQNRFRISQEDVEEMIKEEEIINALI